MNQKTVKRMDIRKLTALGMLAALATLIMFLFRIPILPPPYDFLKLDFKDVIIGIAGLMYGPFPAFLISVVVSFIEMITVSTAAFWGLFMNVLSTACFVCIASFIYQRRRSMKGALAGLVIGVVLMTGSMLIWNYFIMPIYMGLPREAVAKMLLPGILPFNLLKASINAALILLLYKPLVEGLRRARLLPESAAPVSAEAGGKKHISIGIVLAALAVLATCVVYILVRNGVF